MPDTPIAPYNGDPYHPRMEERVARLEEGMQDVKASIVRLDERFVRLEDRTARIENTVTEIKAMLVATLPHLATKAELTAGLSEQNTRIAALTVALGEKPSKTYMWGILAVLLTAYACGLAGLAVLR
jgi:predicted RNase H-like nuclease (RuvC/YqgF family)